MKKREITLSFNKKRDNPASDPNGDIVMDTSTNLHDWVDTESFTYTSDDLRRFFRLKKTAT